ncbi:hypothetical protein JR338_00100 [Chloroflexota bacterium]|nr:hypothetical protein JR338_00100 [Chloroflexota bacterium]
MPPKKKFLHRLRLIWRLVRSGLLFCVLLVILAGSTLLPGDLTNQIETLIRPIAFDYGTWTVQAAGYKLAEWGFSFQRFLTPEQQSDLVRDYIAQVGQVQALEAEILLIYANPNIADPATASQDLQAALAEAEDAMNQLAPLAESILETQLMNVVREIGLETLGEPFPPSLFESSEVPNALIVSPRERIEQILNIAILPGMSTDEDDNLENRIFYDYDQSALVVPIGGIGTYPTMVMQSTNLPWLTETIAHEWTHNYLTLRPLGLNYETTPELRTINETTATLAGKELGRLILEKYYPEAVPVETTATDTSPTETVPVEPEAFIYQTEMRITREEVDRLLAEGKVEKAETYMEARRQVFWENGYLIRKLNQAYFAFYGAYNDTPGGGAAGEDPVGPAVQAYRGQFDSLADFLRAIAWVDSFAELQERVNP